MARSGTDAIVLFVIFLAPCGVGLILLGVGAVGYLLYLVCKWAVDKYKSKSLVDPSVIPCHELEPVNILEKPMAKITEIEAFEDTILEVGYLRDYSYRFISVEDRAYELITKYKDSKFFLNDVMRECHMRKDFASKIIWQVGNTCSSLLERADFRCIYFASIGNVFNNCGGKFFVKVHSVKLCREFCVLN